jgi:hypothetical protein
VKSSFNFSCDMEYRKRPVDALVFFSFLLLGYFAAHAHDEKGK